MSQLSLTTSHNSSLAGQLITMTVISSQLGDLSVDLYDCTTLLTTSQLSNSTASFNVADLAVGWHTLTAQALNHVSNQVKICVTKATPKIDIKISHNPSLYGQSVNVTVSVISPYSLIPSGNVHLSNGSLKLDSKMIDIKGCATLSVNTLEVGTLLLKISYSGDALHLSCNTVCQQTVNLGLSQISLQWNENYQLTAVVSPRIPFGPSTTGLASGTIMHNQQSYPLDQHSQVYLPYDGLSPISLSYSGDHHFKPCVLTQPPIKIPSELISLMDDNQFIYHQPIKCQFKISSSQPITGCVSLFCGQTFVTNLITGSTRCY